MTPPSWVIEKWLYSILSGDAQLASLGITGVYVDVVPRGAAGLYVYITGQSFEDVAYTGERIVYTNSLYAIRVVGEVGGYGDLAQAADRVHDLLQRASGSTDAGEVFAAYRERPFRMAESPTDDRDRAVRHLGGIYRIYATG